MSAYTSTPNPKILLLGGGIEFQRQDVKLASLVSLVEQETRYIELLVEKVMLLQPGAILYVYYTCPKHSILMLYIVFIRLMCMYRCYTGRQVCVQKGPGAAGEA